MCKVADMTVWRGLYLVRDLDLDLG